MKEFLVNIVKISLSILIIIFIEEYFFKFTNYIGLHLSNTSFVTLIIYIIEFIFIYIIYGSEIRSAFSKYQNKLGNNILYTAISFIVIFIVMMITNYIVKLIAKNLGIAYDGLSFINVFEKSFDFDLFVLLLKNIIIIPFVKVCIFVLGIDNLFKGKASAFISGFTFALYNAFINGGQFGDVFIMVIPDFVLFVLLSCIYNKNNNIAYSIISLILYELLAGLLVIKLL